MSWGKGIIAGLALSCASLVISPVAAVAGVVVSSSGPSTSSFPVGRQIGENERITLRDGDAITVLDNGRTRILRGAGSFVLSQQSGSSRNRAFTSLTSQRSATRARTGAVRGTSGAQVSNPNLWYVDVATGGTICLPDSDSIRLWRADTQAASTYSITAPGVETQASFPAGEMLAAWDLYNLPTEGETYRIGHSAGAVDVNFVFLAETPETAEDMASVLIANGCHAQLDQMSNALMGG